MVALVDEQDLQWLKGFKWQVEKHACTHYAGTSIKIDGKWKRIRLHRMIMGANPGELVDHINCNGLDNRRCNLRFASPSINSRNRKKGKRRSSQFVGVHYSKERKKWCASIKVAGRYKNLGRYETEERAAEAYREALKHV